MADSNTASRFQVNAVLGSERQPKFSLQRNGQHDLNSSGNENHAFEMGDEIPVVGSEGGRLGALESLRNSVRNVRSLRQSTREALPRLDNYRNIFQFNNAFRPTLEELHESGNAEEKPTENVSEEKETERVKFGWIEGVLIRNVLSIWGIMLFLRISWVVAEAGIYQTLIIIAISTFITLTTALSMSAIATNGEIGGGGTYYVMSRILGPEFGGSIGVIFAIANAINASLNIVGFCQSMQDLLKNYAGKIIVDGGDNDTRIIGVITTIAVCALCGLGMKYEAKTQVALLIILLVALGNFIVGSIIGPKSEMEEARGFLGYDLELFAENWQPGYSEVGGIQQNFFSVFSVFFPACIGILSGANISGDLKDPNGAIPKGTILAILITSLSYAVVAIICAGTMKREATGSIDDLHNGTSFNCTIKNCTAGIYNDYQAMTLVSGFGPLNYAGCFAASISSAMASYVSCPKLLQVIGDDRIYPWLHHLCKGYGKSKEPVRAYVFTFILALIFVLIAQLDQIALLISNFFLATFALMNFSTFHVCFIKPIGWRPTFKYYDMWLSLFTSLVCVACMFLIDWKTALATLAIIAFLYLLVVYRKPEVNWGSSTQAQTYKTALVNVQQLVHVEEHVKNYRPQVLVLSGLPGSRPALVDFAYLICKKNSLMVCGHIVRNQQSLRVRNTMVQKAYKWLRINRIKSFYSLVDNLSMQQGAAALLETVGIGKMKPNVLLMGYKQDWRTSDKDSLEQYFGVIHSAFDLHVAVAILRVPEGLDYTGILGEVDGLNDKLHTSQSMMSMHRDTSMISLSQADSGLCDPTPPGTPAMERNDTFDDLPEICKKEKKIKKGKSPVYLDPAGNELPKETVNSITQFQRKQKKGTIDVWWLYDDGGLTLLLPYIIKTRSNFSSCKLRVFSLASSQQELDQEQQSMAALLSKFRVDYSDLIVISDLNTPPQQSTKTWFDGVIQNFVHRHGQNPTGAMITESELIALREKTHRHMRLRELLLQHSKNSSLVFMTLPMPRKGTVSAALYMAWLETLTADMPPFLLVRGNQTSVLTYYS